MVTSVDIREGRTFLGRELPGLALCDTRIIVPGEGTNISNLPYESSPPLEVLLEERKAIDEMIQDEENPFDENSVLRKNGVHVLIHHTHSWESFLPHLPGVIDRDLAIHNEMNITKIGEQLGRQLNNRGIQTKVDTTNMTNKIHNRNVSPSHAYSLSREIIESSLQENTDINFIFDLHRDAARREQTTVTIDNEVYARTLFVIGEGHPDYKANLEYNQLEKMYPGLSRGIFGKDSSHF
jgi:stage II sporulation protein P